MPRGRKPKQPTTPAANRDMPDSIKGKPIAEAKWKSLVEQLGKRQLTQLSKDHCTRYCEMYHLYYLALDKITADGLIVTAKNGYPCQSPAVTILCQLTDRMRRIAMDLGLDDEAVAYGTGKWSGLVQGM